jgi:hypothetical protein
MGRRQQRGGERREEEAGLPGSKQDKEVVLDEMLVGPEEL